jgi:hypothetical protein
MEPLHTAASSDFGSPGPIIDFQAPLQHTLVKDNARKKKPFEKMFLEGRPPVNIGVTSNGDIFGGSQISFGDVTGDRQFNVYIASISQYRTTAASFINLSRRFQYALQGYSQTTFFYGQANSVFYDPAYSDFIDRDLAQATRTVRGGSALGIYPISRYRRVQFSGGFENLSEEYNDPDLGFLAYQYQVATYGQPLFRDGSMIPLSVEFIQETTVFRDFGPLAGNTVRLSYDVAPNIGSLLSRQTIDADLRHYLRLGSKRPARDAGEDVQELRGVPRLHLLWRQLGVARLRLPAVLGAECVLRQRGASLPPDRGSADANRGHWRHQGSALREYRGRLVRRPAEPNALRGGRRLHLHDERPGSVPAHPRVRSRPVRPPP